MTEGERIDYLIKVLEGDNAARFSEKTGIDKSSLSRMRNGKIIVGRRVEDILSAYPEVSRVWMETGEGYPGDLSIDLVRKHFIGAIKEKDRVIASLTEELALQRDVIRMLMEKGQH